MGSVAARDHCVPRLLDHCNTGRAELPVTGTETPSRYFTANDIEMSPFGQLGKSKKINRAC